MSAVSNNSSPFPIVSFTDPTYDVVMDNARKEYNTKYTAYSLKLTEIKTTTETWDKLTDDQIKNIEAPEFRQNYLVPYIAYRNIRDDCEKILTTYNQAIAQCDPPLLDSDTLTVLQRLKIKISDIQASYDKVFVTDLNQLIEQRKAIKSLFDNFKGELLKLRAAGEPMAKKFHPNAFYVEVAAMGYNSFGGGSTPSFTKAINEYIKQQNLTLSPQKPPQENKVNT